MSRIVVIGAGVGGLTAAIRLAAAGHSVVVHEQSQTVGGKLGVYERDGFRFDTGPSLLTLPEVFTDLGLSGVDPVALDPVVRHIFPDGTVLDSSSTPEVFRERIAAALGPDAARTGTASGAAPPGSGTPPGDRCCATRSPPRAGRALLADR